MKGIRTVGVVVLVVVLAGLLTGIACAGSEDEQGADILATVNNIEEKTDNLTLKLEALGITIGSIDQQVGDTFSLATSIEEDTDNLTPELEALGITIGSIDQQVVDTFSLATSIEEDTDTLTLEIQSLETRLSAIEGELGSVSRTETYMGRERIEDAGTDVYVFESDYYPQGAHFHVTLDIITAVELGDYLRIGRYYTCIPEGSCGVLGRFQDYSDPGLHTFEFDGYHFKIYYTTDGTPGLYFGWGVTITYAG